MALLKKWSIRAGATRIAALLRKRRLDTQLDAELHLHLEMLVQENIRNGMTPEQARLAALRTFGGVDQTKEAYREQRGIPVLDSLIQDVRYGIRQLARNPGFAAITIFTLALGIGANTAVFTLTNALLLRSLPVPKPDELVRYHMLAEPSVDQGLPATFMPDCPLSGPMFASLRKNQSACTDLLAWGYFSGLVTTDSSKPRLFRGGLASGSSFKVLGVRPEIGRLLDDSDDRPGGGPDGWWVNISYGFWQSEFRGDPQIAGRGLVINHTPVRIAGVLPRGFEGVMVGADPQIILPLEIDTELSGGVGVSTNATNVSLTVIGRLKPGVTLRQARANLLAIAPLVTEEAIPDGMRQDPLFRAMHWDMTSGASGWSDYRRDYQKPLVMAQALAATLLILISANLAGLLLARGATRGQELGIRAALGASRPRLVRQLLTENGLLALAAFPLGCLFAWWASRVLLSLLVHADDVLDLNLAPDPAVLAIAATSGFLTVMLAGCAPAFILTRAKRADVLVVGSRQTHGPGWGWFGRLLMPTQLAVSLLLISVASVCVGSLARLLTRPSGMNEQGVYMVEIDRISPRERGAITAPQYTSMLQYVSQQRGVGSATLLFVPPMDHSEADNDFIARDSSGAVRENKSLFFNQVGPHFLETFGIGLISGRDFKFADGPDSPKVCILNQSAGQYFFPGAEAIGKYIESPANSGRPRAIDFQIVGIAQDAKYTSLHEDAPPTLYISYAQNEGVWPTGPLTLAMRSGDPGLLYNVYKDTLNRFAPDAPVSDLTSLRSRMIESISVDRLAASLSCFLGGLALLLTCVSLYGQVSWNVMQRRGEIGIRMALGATRGSVQRLFLMRLALPLAIGTAAGLGLNFAVSRVIAPLLYDTNPTEPLLIACAATSLVLSGLLAAYLPARRGASIDPMGCLRAE
jgi:putative ABC transport system permease protein